MALIRAVTFTVLLSFILLISAAGTFIYLLSGYPSPEISSFNIDAENETNFAETNVTIRNLGGGGLVTVQIQSMEEGIVFDSVEREFLMTRNETRNFIQRIEGGEHASVTAFAPERPDVVRDRSEIVERIPEP